jgi:hypothetical protein
VRGSFSYSMSQFRQGVDDEAGGGRGGCGADGGGERGRLEGRWQEAEEQQGDGCNVRVVVIICGAAAATSACYHASSKYRPPLVLKFSLQTCYPSYFRANFTKRRIGALF